jgi:hypothetical protein
MSRYGRVIMLFGTYYLSTVFEPRSHQTQNGLGQVANGCLSRIIRKMHTDYVWHTPAFVASMWWVSVYGELKWLSGGTLCQADLLSGATASNSFRKNIGLSKLSPDSTLYRKVAERRDILLNIYYKIWACMQSTTSQINKNLRESTIIF